MKSNAMQADNENTMKGGGRKTSGNRFETGNLIMGRYEVLEELGRGGMGVVYKCFDRISELEAALKSLPVELRDNTWEMSEIKRNFQLVCNLKHPNIASYNNLEKDSDGVFYLVMEYVDGEELRYFASRRRFEDKFTEEMIIDIFRQLADALDYAHKQRIIHRDIKPGNIMIDRNGNVKLLDFGLAEQIHTTLTAKNISSFDNTSGTLPYMSPEQWLCINPGAASDQYSLAVTLYEILAGSPPFNSPDKDNMRHSVLNVEPPELEGVSPAIAAAVMRAMSKKPKDRFSSCAEFVKALSGEKKVQVKAEKTEKAAAVQQSAPQSKPLNPEDVELYYDLLVKIENYCKMHDFSAFPDKIRERFAEMQDSFGEIKNSDADSASFEVLQRLQKETSALDAMIEIDGIQKNIAEMEEFLQETETKISSDALTEKRKAEFALKRNDYVFAVKCLKNSQNFIAEIYQNAVSEQQKTEAKRAAAEAERLAKEAEIREAEAAAEKKRQIKAAKEIFWEKGVIDLPGGVQLELVKIKAGKFIMGSPAPVVKEGFFFDKVLKPGELGRRDLETQHEVILTQDYWLGKFQVTQAQWRAVMGNNPSFFEGDDLPVERVSWDDTTNFCDKLNKLYADKLPDGYRFGFPTEAQWEYACRAGTASALNNGKDLTTAEGRCMNLDEVAWYKKNSKGKTHPVGQKKPNNWGLYDMHGNVLEWCRGWRKVWAEEGGITMRGGYYDSVAGDCRSASGHYFPGNGYGSAWNTGFRLALVPEQ